MRRVLVTGATGRIGKEVVARLARAGGFHVRAAIYSPSKAGYLTDLGANELQRFDYTDRATWDAALDGVDMVYSASLDPLLEHHLKFCDYLGERKDQIKQVVRVSCMGADTVTASYDKDLHVSREGAPIPLMLQHYWWGEEALIKNGLPLTVLRANFFMNHLLKTDCENIDAEGWFSNPLGVQRNSFVCTNDIAEAAVVCLAEGPERQCAPPLEPRPLPQARRADERRCFAAGGSANKFYDLTGPVPQNMHEIAADLGRALGKKVEYRPQSFEQFEADFGSTRAAFFEYLTNGFYSRCSPDFYNLTGRKPTSYYDYLVEKGAAGETGLEELYQANMWKKGEDAMKDAAKVSAA